MRKTLLLLAASAAIFAQQVFWAPKPARTPEYTPPHRPLTKLAEVRAKHAGSADWRELVVDDSHLHAEYISSAPGTKSPRRLHPDTREWWIVLDGQLRYFIDGQEPFVASKGSIVQVPMRTLYSMETISERPSLRFEVNIAGAQTLYPREAEPPHLPGFEWLPIRLPQPPGVYDRGNKPHVSFAELAANAERQKRMSVQRVVNDDRAVANLIYGYEKDLPPIRPGDRGHYHPECAEFWLIMAGQIRYAIENQGVLIASEGDVVYVPRFTFHLPRFYGPGPSCRLAMNGYPEIAHLFDGGGR